QRLDAVKRWQATQIELHKEKEQLKHSGSHQHCVFLRVKNAAHASFEGNKKNTKNGKLQKNPRLPKHGSSAGKKDECMISSSQLSAFSGDLRHTDSATFEEAIQQSVRATSQGNPEEDAMIERAIRASVTELRAATKSGDEKQAIQRAIQASIAEATRAGEATVTGNDSPYDHNNDRLHQALHRSVSSHNDQGNSVGRDEDDSGVDTDDDENIRSAIERSQSDYQRSQEVEKQSPQEEEYSHKARTEEEIVLEYVKKQSLLEEEHRRSLESMAGGVSRTSGDTGEESISLVTYDALVAAESILQDLSIDNNVIVAESGGDLLAASVPEILAKPARLNIVAFVMAVDSATAAIGMETKLHRISEHYNNIPKYVVGSVANLRANKPESPAGDGLCRLL
ncbi:MAG: hypothetical protein L6R42_003231, partial [Xanthoria sp. 1 TBL-2021]